MTFNVVVKSPPTFHVKVRPEPSLHVRAIARIIPADGEDGIAATIAVGTVTTLPNGSPATVANAGTANAAVFNFGIPVGEDGEKGDTGERGATIAADTGAPTDPAGDGDLYIDTTTGDLYRWEA